MYVITGGTMSVDVEFVERLSTRELSIDVPILLTTNSIC